MKDQSLSRDIISTLPPSIIETILCFLPLKEAGRTSILSRKWRYSWTEIPKLDFDTYEILSSKGPLFPLPALAETLGRLMTEAYAMMKRSEFIHAVYQILLLHHGPIHEFIISYYLDSFNTIGAYDEIDQIIAQLLKHNTLTKLVWFFPCDLPLSICSLNQLTDLYLRDCRIRYMPTFNGYGSLTNLCLQNVNISKKALLHILSNNPLLISFSLFIEHYKLILDDDSTIADLFKCLPMVDNISVLGISHFEKAAVPQALPASLPQLKHFWIGRMRFTAYELPFLIHLIRSSPKLESLHLELSDLGDYTHNWEDYSDIWLDHLVELEIKHFSNIEREFEFVKLILAKSPVLKKVTIEVMRHPRRVAVDEKVEMLRYLLYFPRASPFAEVIVN